MQIVNVDAARVWGKGLISTLAAADVSGTYARALTTVTVTLTNHGQVVNSRVYADFTTGAATDGVFTVTAVIDANTFTFTHGASGTTSGNITLKRWTLSGAVGLANVVNYVGFAGLIFINFSGVQPDTNYIFQGTGAGNAGAATNPGSGTYICEGEPAAAGRLTGSLYVKCMTEGGDGQYSLGQSSGVINVEFKR